MKDAIVAITHDVVCKRSDGCQRITPFFRLHDHRSSYLCTGQTSRDSHVLHRVTVRFQAIVLKPCYVLAACTCLTHTVLAA